jgi:hypothetical protein
VATTTKGLATGAAAAAAAGTTLARACTIPL